MPGRLRPPSLLAGAALGVALSLTAGAAPARFAGVTWQDPAGMTVSGTYKADCPGRCVVYEGKDDDFPLIRVHEALLGGAPAALKTLMAFLTAEQGEVVTVVRSGGEQVGGMRLHLAVLQRQDEPDDRRPDFSVFLLLEQGGVTLPLELHALDRGDVAGERFALLAALADTVRLSPETVRGDVTARTQAFAGAAKAIADGYARGERARVYEFTRAGVENVYGLNGLELVATRTTRTAAFLPGGVFLDRPGEPDYRAPNLRRMGRGELPARWKSVPGGFQVTGADGKVTLYTLGKKDGTQTSVTARGQVYWELPRLNVGDIVGVFTTLRTSSSGGALGPGATAVYSRSDQDLELLPGGRYRSSNRSFTAISGSHVAGGVGSQGEAGGRWSYDPASYTLTLKPDGGGNRSGPTYAWTFSPAGRQAKNTDWTLLGDDNWWKTK